MTAAADRASIRRGEGFLAALGTGSDVFDASRVVVVAAHPDDETIGIGGCLPRLRAPWILHVTDGAPRNLRDAQAKGFATARDYAAERRRELECAMAIAGVHRERLIGLGIADQEASLHLVEISRRVQDFLRRRRIEVAVTHPFEGGHPDHDATAFAVHAACAMISQEGGTGPALIEFTSYHAGAGTRAVQVFPPSAGRPELAVALDDDARRRKAQMFECHRTQRDVLARFDVAVERFRLAPIYDFSALPNGGALHYADFDWGITGEDWRRLARDGLRELGLGERL